MSGLIASARRGGVEEPEVGPVDLREVLTRRLSFWSVAAGEQLRPFTADIAAGAMPVELSQRALEALIDIVISNALQHTSPGTAIAVTAIREPGWVEVTIDDAGPGFPSDAVVERGVRGRESEGTGLGLDIARRSAVAAGGTLSIGVAPIGGAQVRVRLPLAVDEPNIRSIP